MRSGRATKDLMKMGELYNLLEKVRIEAEIRIKSELSFPGEMIKISLYNIFMPFFVNVVSDKESNYFAFQEDGAVSLHTGTHNKPDVIVSGDHTELKYLLQKKDKNRFLADEKTGKIKIIAHTFKGRRAVERVRKMFI